NDPITPPLIAPPVPSAGPIRTAPSAPSLPLGEGPDERAPIPSVIAAIESILRQPRRVLFQLRQPGAGRLIAAMLLVSVVCSLTYGFVVGTFSNGVQLWAAPLKISLGLLIS